MKQRLLLALLMLLTSAGFMKAQTTYPDQTINVVIPATPDGEKTVTITFAGAFGDQSYPDLVQGTASSEAIGADKKSYTYTFKSKKDAPINNLSFATAYDEAWGNVTITVDGPVSSFIVGDGNASPSVTSIKSVLPLLPHVTSIAFTNNEKNLASLKLGTNSTSFGYFPELISFYCPEHNLVYIPNKTTAPKMTSYDLGKVDLSNVELKKGAANNFQFAVAELNFSGITPDLININDLTITNLRDKNGNALTEQVIVSQPKDVANGYWVFKNASEIYMDGTYTADIVVVSTNKSYPGLVFGNVTLVVDPVDFVLKDDGTDKTQGSYDVYKQPANAVVTETTPLNKGDELLVTPKPEKGYVFKSFTVNNGLTKIASVDGDPENSARYKVVGNVNPTIKADFSYGTAKLTYTTTTNKYSEMTVYSGRIGEYTDADRLSNDAELTVGSYVTIVARALEGEEVSKVTVNGTEIEDQDKDNSKETFKAEIQVPAQGVDVVVYFGGIEKRTLTIKKQGSGLNTVSVKDNTNYNYPLSESASIYYYCDVVPETRLTIGFTLMDPAKYTIESVTVNGSNYWPSGVTRLEDGSYQINGYRMPNENVKIVITAKELSEITVDLLDPMTFDYDGLPHEVSYKTTPAGIDGIKVTYIKDGVSCNPIDAGTYTVKFEREADENFKKLDESKTFTINTVPLYITQLPTVTKNEDGSSFSIEGGEVRYIQGAGYSSEVVDGEFVFSNDPDGNGIGGMTFIPDDVSNFSNASTCKANVAYGDKAKDVVSVDVLNEAGDAWLIVKNGSAVVSNSVVKDTELTFAIQNKDENLIGKYRVYQVNDEDEVISDNLLAQNDGKFKTYADYKTLRFKLTVEDDRHHLTLDELATTTYTCDYKNGQSIEYPIETTFYNDLKVKETGASLSSGWNWASDQDNWTITYYDQNEREIATPVNAGTYKVKAVRKATGSYYAFETECTLVINKIDIPDAENLIPLPTASRITKGSPLYYSYLSGASEVAGYYTFNVVDPNVTLSESKPFAVKFIPRNSNYNDYEFKESVTVPVTEKAVLQLYTVGYGSIEITDETGRNYVIGNEVVDGTKLTVKAIPDSDCELVSIMKDGQSMSNPFTFVFGDEPVYIYAEFKVKEVEVEVPGDPVIDENSQYTITLPTSLVGAKLSKTGVYSVKRGGSFSFSVATLAADASKVVVKIGNVTIKPSSSGVYTLSDITSNYTVSVSLPNPTEIKLTVPTEYKNAGGYLMGRVQVQGPRSTGKFYYNDEVTLIAFPESGVKFAGWTGDVSGLTQVKEIVLTKDLSVKATFSGTPTGIEDIMAASITTGKGCVWVRGIANADVTIVSIAGRVQAQERISGDTRIDVPAGIYVVVLESGSDVKRVKVIVK